MLRVNSEIAWVGRVGVVALLAVPGWAPPPLAAQSTRVTFADPSRVELMTDGSAVEVVLEGEGLTAFTGGVFEAGGAAVRGVRVEVTHGRDGRTRVVLAADPSAAGMAGELVLFDRTMRFVVREVAVRVAAGFEPVVVSTGTLSMTGRRFSPVAISTEGLSMVGRRFVPVTITTGGLSMTGRRFRPVRINTPALSMTGRRNSKGGSR